MTTRSYGLVLSLTLAFVAIQSPVPLVGSPSPSIKRSSSDRDINAIGRRDIIRPQDRTFIGSAEKEKERGTAWAAAVERSMRLIHDPALTAYLVAMAQNLARNSDAQMPITVTLIDSDEVNYCTAPGGYQYVTRGLILQLESEGELAAVFAHGIAHTALHSPTRQAIRQNLMNIGPVQNSAFAWAKCLSPTSVIANGMRPTDEFDADFFAVQYLYKAGYDPDCYVRFAQRTWPSVSGSANSAAAFSHFPPTSQRLKALRGEVTEILPQRGEATVSTSAFEEFMENLHVWQTGHPEPKQSGLRRANTSK